MNPLKDLSYKNLSSAKFELREVPLLGNPIEKKERGMGEKRDTETDSGKRRRAGRNGPYPKSKRGMPSIQDVPNLLLTEENGILALPNKLDIETKRVLQQCKQDGHDRGVGNVQILERVVRESRNQMITLDEGGMMKLQQCVNQAERLKAGEKWHVFLGNIWGVCRIILLRKCKK